MNRRDFMHLGAVALPAGMAFTDALHSQALAAEPQADPLPEPDELIHVLNRTSFGIHRNDLASAQQLGLDEYLRQQIYQESADNTDMEAQLARQYPEAFLPRKLLVEYYLGGEPGVGVPFSMPRQLKPYTADAEAMYRDTRDMGEEAYGMLGAVPMPKQVNDVRHRRNPGKALTALREMTLYRAYRSPHQLFEVMVEFWGNHFSIDASSHPNLYVHKLLDDREVIRPNAMSDFRSLLYASAKSTAMLYYLDGVSNVKGAANENYARELMELHTIGVDGGYTHNDVLEVARCFTGWTIDRDTADFTFNASKHDDGEKIVLGHRIPPGGGIEDGHTVLDILLAHPATARRIATKLVQRFVSDEPPTSLVNAVIGVFDQTNGDIKAMLGEILYSTEFRQAVDEKLKRPIHFVVSALRATNAGLPVTSLGTLVWHLVRMGQLPYNWPMPDGYPDDAGYWASTNSLMHRWRYGVTIGKGGGANIDVDVEELTAGATTPRTLVETLRNRVLRRQLSADDGLNLVAYAAQGGDADEELSSNQVIVRGRNVLGLLLNSSYFQLR